MCFWWVLKTQRIQWSMLCLLHPGNTDILKIHTIKHIKHFFKSCRGLFPFLFSLFFLPFPFLPSIPSFPLSLTFPFFAFLLFLFLFFLFLILFFLFFHTIPTSFPFLSFPFLSFPFLSFPSIFFSPFLFCLFLSFLPSLISIFLSLPFLFIHSFFFSFFSSFFLSFLASFSSLLWDGSDFVMCDMFGPLEALQRSNLVRLRQVLHIAALWMGISSLSGLCPLLPFSFGSAQLRGNMIKVVTWISLPSQTPSSLGLLARSRGLGRGEGSRKADKRCSKEEKTFKMMDEHTVCVWRCACM